MSVPFFSFSSFSFLLSTRSLSGSTLHVALPSGTETLVRHHILIPFLFGCVYQAGTYFVAENQMGKGVHGTLPHWKFKSFMGFIIHLLLTCFFVASFFFNLGISITPSVCLEQTPEKLHK
jgi:hypothetical protein